MKKLHSGDILQFMRQLSVLLSAGLSLMKSLVIILQTTEKKELHRIVYVLKSELESGRELSQVLRRYPSYFDSFTCQLIRIGEESGNLEKSLRGITVYQEKSQLFRKQLLQALLYPALILMATLATTLFLLLFVVPQFATLFAHLPNQLPWVTRLFIKLALELRNHGFSLIFLFGFVSLTFFYFYGTERFKQLGQGLILKIPPLRDLAIQVSLTRFSRSLALMLTAGLPLTEALLLAAPLSPFEAFRKNILSMHAGVHAGRPLSSHFKPPFFASPLLHQLIRIGEESGSLEAMFEKFADLSETELDQRFALLKQILEPLIIAILGALIGVIVLAMYLPIFRLGTALS